MNVYLEYAISAVVFVLSIYQFFLDSDYTRPRSRKSVKDIVRLVYDDKTVVLKNHKGVFPKNGDEIVGYLLSDTDGSVTLKNTYRVSEKRKPKLSIFAILLFLILPMAIVVSTIKPEYRKSDVNVSLTKWVEQSNPDSYSNSILRYTGVVDETWIDNGYRFIKFEGNNVIARLSSNTSVKVSDEISVIGKCVNSGEMLVLSDAVVEDCDCPFK